MPTARSTNPVPVRRLWPLPWPWILAISGVALMVAGGFAGDYWAILANARMICLSCIGIQ